MTGGKRNGSLTRAVVLVTLAGTALALVLGLRSLYQRGDLNDFICETACGPEAVASPSGLLLESGTDDTSVGAGPPSAMDESAVADAIQGALADAKLGGHRGVAVGDFTGAVVTAGDTDAFIPASTTKLLTGFAALRALGPQERFTTRVVRADDTVVLVGGGDPYLDTLPPEEFAPARQATIKALAVRTARALKAAGVTTVRVGYDATLFDEPAFSPSWEAKYERENIVAPVDALEVDGARHDGLRDDDPAEVAAARFVAALRKAGITVAEELGETSAAEAVEVTAAASGTVAQIVESVETYSDNEGAEVLLRHLAIDAEHPATFDGGVAAVTQVLADAGIDAAELVLNDGSGLSRSNRIRPETLVSLLVAAAQSEEASALIGSLPVAGVSGSLAFRFANQEQAAGLVRAKTGTLDGVHSLAGVVTTRDGHLLAFAVMADDAKKVNDFVAQASLDRVAAALANCACGSTQ